MQQHHGELLRKYLAINRVSVSKLAKKMSKSKVTLYSWIKKPVLDLVQLDELKKAGIEIGVENFNEEKKPESVNEKISNTGNPIIDRYIANLESQLKYQQEINKDLLDLYHQLVEQRKIPDSMQPIQAKKPTLKT